VLARNKCYLYFEVQCSEDPCDEQLPPPATDFDDESAGHKELEKRISQSKPGGIHISSQRNGTSSDVPGGSEWGGLGAV